MAVGWLPSYPATMRCSVSMMVFVGCLRAPDVSSASETGEASATSGLLVLAGGGAESEMDDVAGWSNRAYGALLSRGDVTGDGWVRVGVLSVDAETDWIPEAFRQLGADAAENVQIATREDAEIADLSGFDVLFLKGGDQGVYYDRWNDTEVERAIRELWAAGGAIGGTSAGAMSLSEVALAGSRDLISADVMADSHTPYLDDTDGGSGVHADFIGLLGGALVDTHFTERGRLGRLLGALARDRDERGSDHVGIGIERRTALVVEEELATVIGEGSVTFVHGGGVPIREPGVGLGWSGLSVDRLVDGGMWDLAARQSRSVGESIPSAGSSGWNEGPLRLDSEEHFAVEIETEPYATRSTTGSVQRSTLGWFGAFERERRALCHEALYRGLYDYGGYSGFLVGSGWLERTADPDVLEVYGESVMVFDSSVELSGQLGGPSPYDPTTAVTSLQGLTLHVLAPGMRYDTEERRVVR